LDLLNSAMAELGFGASTIGATGSAPVPPLNRAGSLTLLPSESKQSPSAAVKEPKPRGGSLIVTGSGVPSATAHAHTTATRPPLANDLPPHGPLSVTAARSSTKASSSQAIQETLKRVEEIVSSLPIADAAFMQAEL
jgi:hypothetical protein